MGLWMDSTPWESKTYNEKKCFSVAISCRDKQFYSALPTRKKVWVTPKISPMDASCTDGSLKPPGADESVGTDEEGDPVTYGVS